MPEIAVCVEAMSSNMVLKLLGILQYLIRDYPNIEQKLIKNSNTVTDDRKRTSNTHYRFLPSRTILDALRERSGGAIAGCAFLMCTFNASLRL